MNKLINILSATALIILILYGLVGVLWLPIYLIIKQEPCEVCEEYGTYTREPLLIVR